jgi:hypothetical protein
MPIPSLLVAADMIVKGSLPGNGYSAFKGVIEALTNNERLLCFRYSGF